MTTKFSVIELNSSRYERTPGTQDFENLVDALFCASERIHQTHGAPVFVVDSDIPPFLDKADDGEESVSFENHTPRGARWHGAKPAGPRARAYVWNRSGFDFKS